jgi:hypothetical protein
MVSAPGDMDSPATIDAAPVQRMKVYPVIGPNPYWETSIRAVAVRGSVLDGRKGMRRL